MKKIIGIIWTLCLFLLPLVGFSQYTETKEFTKRFKVEDETRVEITNKYGKLEVNTWGKDSVVFEVKIRVEEKKLSKLEKAMDDLDFDFTNSRHFLIAKTVMNRSMGTLEKEFLKFKESFIQTSSNVEIDMEVWLPGDCNLKLDNKYGDIIVGELSGEVDITLNHGNLKAHKLSGKTTLNLNFGDATINNLGDARIYSTYSDVYVKHAGELRIDSKQSNFELLELKDMVADSRRDKFRIRMIDLIDAESSFSNFRVSELHDRMSLKSDFGDLNIEQVSPEFSNIFIDSRNTDIDLYFSEESNFDFEISHTKAELELCREVEVTNETTVDEKDKTYKIEGVFGSKASNEKKLIINATSGEINIFSE